MLTSIKYDNHRLLLGNLASDNNIFDISSVSLLIGPNGSGKTRFLQAIVSAFDAEANYGLNRCELYLHGGTIDYRPVKEQWGVVYYTPVQNRPSFRAHDDFVDASKVPAKNMFELVEHRELFHDFGVELKLVARASVQYRKIAEEFASALIENPQFRTSKSASGFVAASEARSRVKTMSHYRDGQSIVLESEQRDRKLHAKLADLILADMKRSCPDEYTFVAAMMVIQNLFPRSGIKQILAFAKEFIGSQYISATIEENEFPYEHYEMFKTAHQQLQLGSLVTTDSHFNYEYVLRHPKRERKHFEQAFVSQLFTIELDKVSSGEWALLNQIIALKESIQTLRNKPNLMILIDEGDAFLHLNWQRQYVYQLNRFLKRCQQQMGIGNLQLILASHSPMLACDIPRSFVCHMGSSNAHAHRKSPPPTFAAPIQSILNLAFEASTMGEFATVTINQTIDNLRNKRCSAKDRYVISIIDDPTIKHVLTEMRDEVLAK